MEIYVYNKHTERNFYRKKYGEIIQKHKNNDCLYEHIQGGVSEQRFYLLFCFIPYSKGNKYENLNYNIES